MVCETLLVELLTEELPPKSLARLGQTFHDALLQGLVDNGFTAPDTPSRWFATPRRLAVSIDAVLATQPDRIIERKGPAVMSGVDAEGRPTKALEGFMRSASVSFSDLERMHDGKAEYFVVKVHRSGERLESHLSLLIEAALKKLPIPKLMRWGSGDAQFVRPVHGLVVLHGSDIVPCMVLGLQGGNATRGHRFMGEGAVSLSNAQAYEVDLEQKGRVIASFDRRRSMIETMLREAAAVQQARLGEMEALLDEVTALVECPAVYVGEFEARFLDVPPECLILTMQQNQKYFPLFNEQGKLLNRFLLVSNMVVDDATYIVGGNERVIRPRLADAQFFFDQDRKQKLECNVEKLSAVVYHNKLGNQLERVQRVKKLAAVIAGKLHADVAKAERAAWLAKADLVTGMVGEFPELQGIMGRYYALHDEEDPVVADAIEAHYRPRFAGDRLPQGNVAAVVSLADKLDALIGFFGIGVTPSGDKDPFGLRRTALAALRILVEMPLPLDLAALLHDAKQGFAEGILQQDCDVALLTFMFDRLRGYLRDAGHSVEAVEAVLTLQPTRVDLVLPKLEAVREFCALPEAAALAAANKRIVNILKKTDEAIGEPDPLLLQEPAEKRLFERIALLAPTVQAHAAGENYTEALLTLAGLREDVDAFFEGVMVMAEEPLTRKNRLALLTWLAMLMNQVADISRLSVDAK